MPMFDPARADALFTEGIGRPLTQPEFQELEAMEQLCPRRVTMDEFWALIGTFAEIAELLPKTRPIAEQQQVEEALNALWSALPPMPREHESRAHAPELVAFIRPSIQFYARNKHPVENPMELTDSGCVAFVEAVTLPALHANGWQLKETTLRTILYTLSRPAKVGEGLALPIDAVAGHPDLGRPSLTINPKKPPGDDL
jgi:hypothetical protein